MTIPSHWVRMVRGQTNDLLLRVQPFSLPSPSTFDDEITMAIVSIYHEQANKLVDAIVAFHKARGQDIEPTWGHKLRTQVLDRFTRENGLTETQARALDHKLVMTIRRVQRGESVEKVRLFFFLRHVPLVSNVDDFLGALTSVSLARERPRL